MIACRTKSDFVTRFLPRELNIIQKLNHPNIIRVYEVIDSPNEVSIVEEYASGGDLLKKIRSSPRKRIEEEKARFYFRQLIEALQYLQTLHVVHRDLKCENVFLDRCGNVKLGDFGFSRELLPGEESRTFCGSKAYVAPEVLRSKPYRGFTVDLWSAGVVLFVTVTGLMPYDDRYPQKMVERQLRHRVIFPRRIPLSEDVKTLIFEILHPVPERRKTYAEIIVSPWLISTPYRLSTEAEPQPDSETSSGTT